MSAGATADAAAAATPPPLRKPPLENLGEAVVSAQEQANIRTTQLLRLGTSEYPFRLPAVDADTVRAEPPALSAT